MFSSRSTSVAVLVSLAGVVPSVFAQADYEWDSPIDGAWKIAANWSPSTDFPDLDGDTATLGLKNAYQATLNSSARVTSLEITNPDATLSLFSVLTLRIYDTVTNDGTILVNENLSTLNSFLFFEVGASTPGTSFVLDGNGEVILQAPGNVNDAQVLVDAAGSLTHTASHTIRGSGQVSGSVFNNGLILADGTGGPSLAIIGTLDQSGGGVLRADGGDIFLNDCDVIGGELQSAGASATVANTGIPSLSGGADITGSLEIPGNGRNVDIAGPISVNGSVSINSTAATLNAALRFAADTTIGGTGTISMQLGASDTNDARLEALGGFSGVIGPGIAVEGAGRLGGTLELQGTADANIPGSLLEITDTLTVSGSGELRANGGEIGLSTATVVGGVFDSSAGGQTRTTAGVSLLSGGATNNGTMAIRGLGHILELDSELENNGTLLINDTLNTLNATLRLSGTPSITGTGNVIMAIGASDTNDAQIEVSAGVTCTIGADQTVSGEGRLEGDGSFVNNGRIEADSALNPLEIRSDVVQGTGVISADGGTLALVDGSITGGTLETSAGGLVSAASGAANAIADLANTGDLGIRGAGVILGASGTIVNSGRVLINDNAATLNATLDLADGASITGTGEINLQLGGADLNDARVRVLAGSATIGSGQTITGSGRLAGDMNVNGAIAPGTSAGEINCQSGTVTRSSTSAYEVEIGGVLATEYDRITGGADHVLAGALNVSEISPFVPAVGDEFVIIDGASVTGKFDTETFPPALPGRAYRVFYEADRVVLVHTCNGDFAPPYDVLDFSDVIAFLTFFGTGNPIVDLAPPFGGFDFSDIIAFLTSFGAGCS